MLREPFLKNGELIALVQIEHAVDQQMAQCGDQVGQRVLGRIGSQQQVNTLVLAVITGIEPGGPMNMTAGFDPKLTPGQGNRKAGFG